MSENGKFKVLVACSPFGETGGEPVRLLKETGWEIIQNPYKRRLRGSEVGELLRNVDAVIAGTEPYNEQTLRDVPHLKVISRVGIGLDSVDLGLCERHGIKVAYTPEAPSDAVAELSVGNILNLLRHIHTSDKSVREHAWNRLMGVLVREVKIGVIGVGRIGTRVIKLLGTFQPQILAYDSNSSVHGKPLPNTAWVSLDELIAQADLISMHIPLTETNRHFISRERIARMKTGAMLINTSRGAVVDELALYDALRQKHLGGAALDVYESEPYDGPLTSFDNVVLTAHIGASARQSRYFMELGAVEGCIEALKGLPLTHDAIKDSKMQ